MPLFRETLSAAGLVGMYRIGDPFLAAVKPSRTMRAFSSAGYCLRVARRMSPTRRADGVSCVLDICLMPTLQQVTKSAKSSPQAASFVSQVSMSDSAA